MSEHKPKSDPTNFTRTVYEAGDPEVMALIEAVAAHIARLKYDHGSKAHLRQVYLRLIWCENVTIDFHKRDNAEITDRPNDQKPRYMPSIIK